MKRWSLALLALLLSACGGALRGGTINTDPPVAAPPTYTMGIVACAQRVLPTAPCPSPIAGAKVEVQHSDGWVFQMTNRDGYTVMQAQIPYSAIRITAPGFEQLLQAIEPPLLANKNTTFSLVLSLPAPPTRAQILDMRITFQGLYVDTAQFGRLPWFEAALPWLTPADRQAVYAAKHASTAWLGGDSHAIISLPSGPALYDEPGQPYSADRFGPLDWTSPADGRLADLVVEVARAGFNKQLLFLGGDAGQAGFPIAMAQLDTTASQLRHSRYGDLGGYVVVLPGWDGVFYGYTPEQVRTWGEKCRSLFVYCGIEHQPGRIPVGEGGGDYLPGGNMVWADLILAEFNGPNDSTDRRTMDGRDSQGRPNYRGNQIWQIGARMLGRNYQPPSDQPADADGYGGIGYLAPGSPRGPYVHCAFEWVGEYFFVRGQQTAEDQQVSRDYFRSAGWTCGG